MLTVRFIWRRAGVGALMVIIIVVGGYFLLDSTDTPWFLVIVIAPLVMLSPLYMMLLYFGASDRDQKARQKYRDKRALARLARMRAGGVKFSLYLRPFASTGGVRTLQFVAQRKRAPSSYYGNDPRFNPGPGVRYRLETKWSDLETLLARFLYSSSELVGLGRPGEQLGASRLPSNDDEWKKLVLDLARKAELIFLLPSLDPGTQWEVRMCLRDKELLNKTVFIVPGTNDIEDYIGRRLSGPALPGRQQHTLPRDSFSEGAHFEPDRTIDELRSGAIKCLLRVGAKEAAHEARNALAGAFIMLTPTKGLASLWAVRGRTMIAVNPIDIGPVFQLDTAALKQALLEIRIMAAGHQGA